MKPNDGTCWLWIQLETNQNKLQGVSILPQITFIHSQNASHKENKQNSYKWRWQKAQHKMNHLQFIFPTKVMLEESILLLKPSRCKQETEGTHTWKQPWVMRCFKTISALSSPALLTFWRQTQASVVTSKGEGDVGRVTHLWPYWKTVKVHWTLSLPVDDPLINMWDEHTASHTAELLVCLGFFSSFYWTGPWADVTLVQCYFTVQCLTFPSPHYVT